VATRSHSLRINAPDWILVGAPPHFLLEELTALSRQNLEVLLLTGRNRKKEEKRGRNGKDRRDGRRKTRRDGRKRKAKPPVLHHWNRNKNFFRHRPRKVLESGGQTMASADREPITGV